MSLYMVIKTEIFSGKTFEKIKDINSKPELECILIVQIRGI